MQLNGTKRGNPHGLYDMRIGLNDLLDLSGQLWDTHIRRELLSMQKSDLITRVVQGESVCVMIIIIIRITTIGSTGIRPLTNGNAKGCPTTLNGAKGNGHSF